MPLIDGDQPIQAFSTNRADQRRSQCAFDRGDRAGVFNTVRPVLVNISSIAGEKTLSRS
jgi:hypothetical protein